MNRKSAKVVPLLKKGDALNPQNYRPVALLPAFSKILEKVIFKQIVEYVELNALLHPSHHGSRAQHNTSTALVEMYSEWIDAIENGKPAGAMLLDLSAAFDLVNHSILLQKFELLGFSTQAVDWCRSYLDGRRQCVYLDGHFSNFEPITLGVPQGSVLGALFYILFVNDLPAVVHDNHLDEEGQQGKNPWDNLLNCHSCGKICCYVDDSTYTVSGADAEEINLKLTHSYRRLSEYFNDNRLVINDAKTQLVIMGTGRHQLTREQVQIDTGMVVVYPVEYAKLLGANIHQSLKWKHHVIGGEFSLIKCLTSRLNSLRLKASNASFKTRLMLANSFFMSSLIYMIVNWGSAEKYLVKTVQVIQNKAARYVSKQSWYTPTRVILQHCGWLSVKQLIVYHSVLQVWKLLVYKAPRLLFSRLQLSNTRSRENFTLNLPPVTTRLGRGSFFVRAVHSWNSLPTDIRSIKKLNTFKKKLKQWISTNIEIE